MKLKVIAVMLLFTLSFTAVYAAPKTQKITTSKSTYTFMRGTSVKLGAKAKTKLTYKTSNLKVAKVSSKGVVTGKTAGTAKITINAAKTSKYKAAKKVVTVKVQNKGVLKIVLKAWDNTPKPNFEIYDANRKKICSGSNINKYFPVGKYYIKETTNYSTLSGGGLVGPIYIKNNSVNIFELYLKSAVEHTVKISVDKNAGLKNESWKYLINVPLALCYKTSSNNIIAFQVKKISSNGEVSFDVPNGSNYFIAEFNFMENGVEERMINYYEWQEDEYGLWSKVKKPGVKTYLYRNDQGNYVSTQFIDVSNTKSLVLEANEGNVFINSPVMKHCRILDSNRNLIKEGDYGIDGDYYGGASEDLAPGNYILEVINENTGKVVRTIGFSINPDKETVIEMGGKYQA